MKKTNPNKIPKTQADVDRAYDKGLTDGADFTMKIVLYILKDKHDAPDEDIEVFNQEFIKCLQMMEQGYLKESDIDDVLKKEYQWRVKLG